MTQVPTGSHVRTYFSMEIMKTSQRHPNIRKLYILTITTFITNLALKMTMTPISFRELDVVLYDWYIPGISHDISAFLFCSFSFQISQEIPMSVSLESSVSGSGQPSAQARTCNCINKSKCPLNKKCPSNNVLYKANIASTTENYRNKIYWGTSETKFKSRYANHRKSFKSRKIQNRHWTFQWNLEAKETKQKCWYIVGNSSGTSVVQHINKMIHVTSKRKN